MANQFSRSMITFGGIKAVLSGSFTIGPGVTPSRCTIYMAPQPEPLPIVATLEVYDNTGGVIFPDCHAQSLSVEINGLTVWAVTIMDTRWRWAYGEISGEYNVRDARDRIIPAQVRTPQQLAKLLFKAMGVERADVSKMPNTLFPEKRWDTANPARELATLLEETGCLVTLGSANVVQVWPIGAGGFLPNDNTLIDQQVLFEIPDVPDAIVHRGGRDQYQIPLRLVPVAEDTDGSIKPYDKVSYAPAANPSFAKYAWGLYDPPFANVVYPEEDDPLKLQKRAVTRNLAAKWILRGFQISLTEEGEPPFQVETIVDGQRKTETIKDIQRILPLNNNRLLRSAPVRADRLNPLAFDPLKTFSTEGPAGVVYGRWFSQAAGMNNLDFLRGRTAAQELAEASDLTRRPLPTGKIDDPAHRFEVYPGSWTLDVERGIVFFAEPVYELLDMDLSGGDPLRDDLIRQWIKVPPLLYLVVSFAVRDALTRAFIHRETMRKLPGKKYGTKPKYLYRTEISYQTWRDALTLRMHTNKVDFDKEANRYLDHEQKRLIGDKPASATYAGFKKLYLDGAIRQVTWFIDDAGYARTRASRNRDEPNVAETYQQKQLYEELSQLLSRNAKEADKERRKFDA
jgi:hypothetical protein